MNSNSSYFCILNIITDERRKHKEKEESKPSVSFIEQFIAEDLKMVKITG
jgi:hypothetical protein